MPSPWAPDHRVPYVLLGTALFCLLGVLSVPLIFRVSRLLQAGAQPGIALGIAALCGLFALYGLAVSLRHHPLSRPRHRPDQREGASPGRGHHLVHAHRRHRHRCGRDRPQPALPRRGDGSGAARGHPLRFMAIVASLVMLLTVVATWGMESPLPDRTDGTAARREDAIGLRQSWALITSSRQVLIFFSFVMLFTLALFLQDPVLESYGAQVFAMPIAATAQLNAFWGIGTLVGLLIAGLWVVPRLGKMATARLGCQLIAFSLLLLLLAGLTARIPFLQVVMVLFGLAAGIGTNSALCLMLDLTLPQAAGTFVGVWGLAQALSRAVGKLLGGGLYDIGRALPLGEGAYGAFALVLGTELLVALAALLLLSRVNLRQFREDTSRSLSRVLAMELG